jgi:hypothetical protein
LIFYGIVQQAGNGLIVNSSILYHQRRHTHKMGYIRYLSHFSRLVDMQLDSKKQRFFKSLGQFRHKSVSY